MFSVFDLLKGQGHSVSVVPFMGRRLYGLKNRSGVSYAAIKVVSVLGAILMRAAIAIGLLFRCWDVLFVQKESLPWGPPLLERLAVGRGIRLIYDIDDGVMVKCDQAGGWRMLWWDPSRVPDVMGLADAVIVGSGALESYALNHSSRVVRIPTGVPDDQFVEPHALSGEIRGSTPVVGWIGTRTNLEYLERIVPALEEANRRAPFILLIVGDKDSTSCNFRSLTVEVIPWSLAGEADLLRRMDVGLMPLPDAEWARYKCGYKMLQYMAAGAVALASPVGENCTIVTHGENGLLCETSEDWACDLERVLTDSVLRLRLATAARTTAAAYAMSVVAPRVAGVVADVIEDGRRLRDKGVFAK